MKEVALLYEPWQAEAFTFADGRPIALDAEVEEILKGRDISFISGKKYRTTEPEAHDAGYQWTIKVLENPDAPYPSYREVPLSRVYFYPLYLYFARAAYWLDLLINLVERNPGIERFNIYPSALRASSTTADFTHEELRALIDCAQLVGTQRGITVNIQHHNIFRGDNLNKTFLLRRYVFSLTIKLWNWLIRFRRRSKIRVLISDHWRNIAPIAARLPEAEFIWTDRMEALKAGLVAMWHWHMRYLHIGDYADHGEAHDGIIKSASQYTVESVLFRGYEIAPFINAACEAMAIKYIPRALKEIDNTYSMLVSVKPDIIMLRVGTASQTHFAVLAWVSRALGIPSVEFQHGLEYNGNESFTSRKNTQYIGSYGERVTKELIQAGIDSRRIINVGSPRFDIYSLVRNMRNKHSNTIVCFYPDLSYGDGFDTFDIDTFMDGVAEAARLIPKAHLVVKLRGSRREAFARQSIARICKDISFSVVKDVPLPELFKECVFAISPYSTVVLEAIQSGVPLILFAPIQLEERFTKAHFTEGSIPVAFNESQLKDIFKTLSEESMLNEAVLHADNFVRSSYNFDEHTASRAASLIRTLAKKP